MRCLIHFLLPVVFIQLGYALELRYYSVADQGMTQLTELEASSDRVIWCGKDLKFDIGIRGVGEDSRIDFNFNQIESFLKEERHKNLLVLYFEKGMMVDKQTPVKGYVSRALLLMKDIGYKRIVILGASGGGVHYLADTDLKKEAPAPSATPPSR